ncbi:MAG: FecR family protein, partial [Deferrisomatales bacterium]|nr:FecR family protein [Deferrisomatales bacterium]
MTRLPAAALLLMVLATLGGCLPEALRGSAAPVLSPVLAPQAAVSTGTVWLQPRHAREARPLAAPVLLEPDDWIETGADGKVELRLPQATLRLYANTRVQVLFDYEQRAAVATTVRVEAGEVLIARSGDTPYEAKTPSLEVHIPPGAVALAGTRGQLYKAACYRGSAEGRHVRVRGQTLVRLGLGQVLTVDDTQSLAFLEDQDLPDEWHRWEQAGVLSA